MREGVDNTKGAKGPKGKTGMSGPASYTHFEIRGGWSEKYVELDDLCLKVLNYLQKNPEIASVVEITKDAVTSKL